MLTDKEKERILVPDKIIEIDKFNGLSLSDLVKKYGGSSQILIEDYSYNYTAFLATMRLENDKEYNVRISSLLKKKEKEQQKKLKKEERERKLLEELKKKYE